jgi:hypothetical protein
VGLRTYGDATMVVPGGQGWEASEGFDAFVPFIDSTIAVTSGPRSGSGRWS